MAVWCSVLYIGATCRALEIIYYMAYKIVGIDNVLMPDKRNTHQCHAGPNWHGLLDDCTPINQSFGAQWRQRHFAVVKFAIDLFFG
jgi:hypothetical protein